MEFIDHIKGSIGFEPYCKKLDGHCIVMESVVMAQARGYAIQSLTSTINNSDRILGCEDRIPESRDSDGYLDIFLVNHVLNSYRS